MEDPKDSPTLNLLMLEEADICHSRVGCREAWLALQPSYGTLNKAEKFSDLNFVP